MDLNKCFGVHIAFIENLATVTAMCRVPIDNIRVKITFNFCQWIFCA